MNYKPCLIARVPTQNPSDLEDPVILTLHDAQKTAEGLIRDGQCRATRFR